MEKITLSTRAINYQIVLYPDSESYNYQKVINNLDKLFKKNTIKGYAWILHDKDVYLPADIHNDQDKILLGKPKKPHTHLVISFNNSTTVRQLCIKLGIPPEALYLNRDMIPDSLKGSVMYLIHKTPNAREKYQYPFEELHTSNDNEYRKLIEEKSYSYEKAQILNDIMEYIDTIPDYLNIRRIYTFCYDNGYEYTKVFLTASNYRLINDCIKEHNYNLYKIVEMAKEEKKENARSKRSNNGKKEN